MNTRIVVLLLGGAVACGQDNGTGPGAGPRDVNGYVASLGSWAAYAPPLPSEDAATGPTTRRAEIVDDDVHECAETPRRLSDTPAEIVMYEPNASVMWVGNLIQGRSYKDGLGSFDELSIRQRAPLRVSIDLLTGDNFAVVDEPSLTTVQSAIGGLIQRANDAGHRSGGSIDYESSVTHSVEQAALSLGLSARYLGARARADLAVQRNAAQQTLVAHFVQKMFTIAVELPQAPGDFFSDELTADLLERQVDAGNIGPDNLPVYLASVTYGRMLTYSLTSTHSEHRMRAAIAASYNGVAGGASGYSEAELQETLAQENVKVTAIGGEGQNVVSLISAGNLKAYFTTDAPLTSARPISYQLNFLGDNALARVSETTDYTLRECEAVATSGIISDFEVDNEAWTVVGGTLLDAFRERIPNAPSGNWVITAEDLGSGTTYFRAPAKFLGSKSAYYGGKLSYWRSWFVPPGHFDGSPYTATDVAIVGDNGLTLTYSFAHTDWGEQTWDYREVTLTAQAGWQVDGRPATEQEIRDVLAGVLQLEIRAEYRSNGTGLEFGFVDRVVLARTPAP